MDVKVFVNEEDYWFSALLVILILNKLSLGLSTFLPLSRATGSLGYSRDESKGSGSENNRREQN